MEIKSHVNEKIQEPGKVATIFTEILALEDELDKEKEHLWVAGLKSNNVIKYIDLVSLGTLNSSLVHPREVFRTAIQRGVASILVCHNHPSGEPAPSSEDRHVTRRLSEASKILDIPVLDHVIIGDHEKYYSFKEQGDL